MRRLSAKPWERHSVSWTNDYHPAFPDARCAADARWTAAVRETWTSFLIHLKKSMRKEWYSPVGRPPKTSPQWKKERALRSVTKKCCKWDDLECRSMIAFKPEARDKNQCGGMMLMLDQLIHPMIKRDSQKTRTWESPRWEANKRFSSVYLWCAWPEQGDV